MTKVIGISGSLRTGSYNTALLRAAAQLMPQGSELEILDIKDIPNYDGDVEAKGFPASVIAAKERLKACDGIVIATPEYNNSMPGVLKNALDWMSRPNTDIPQVFGGKPVAIFGATPGGFGTVFAQTAFLPLFRYFKMRPCYANPLFISQANTKLDADGKLIDEALKESLKKFVHDFVEFIRD